jgi:pimeloyl-ACP methyl ester carboxylesterase
MKINFNLFRILILSAVIILAACTPQQKILPVKDGQLAYYRFGQGSPIVLITGYAATISEWNKTFLQTLARNHEVIVFDNRNVGDSHFTASSYRMNDLVNDANQLITQLNLQKPTVLGWSMGGMVAQQLAIQHPASVGKLVLMSTAIGGDSAIPVSPAVMEKLNSTTGTPAEKFQRALSVLFPAPVVPEMARIFVPNMFIPSGQPEVPPPADVVRKQKLILEDWAKANTVPHELRRLQIPTLILAGTEDAIVSPKNAQILARAIPHAKLVEINGGGHAMMYQYPIKLAQIVNEFVVEQ